MPFGAGSFQDHSPAPGGGSTPGGGSVTIHRLAFAFSTPNLNTGLIIYTPAVGDVIADAWFDVPTAFNGTTPQGDIGTFVGGNKGLFAGWSNLATSIDLSHGDATDPNNVGLDIPGGYGTRLAQGYGYTPMIVIAPNPIRVVVSTTGLLGGPAVGGTAGQGVIYVVSGTPS